MAGPRPLSRMVPDIAGKALGKRGLAFGPLLTDWADIVGPHLAARAIPEKLVFPKGSKDKATLHIRAAAAFALEIQHLEPLIIERINGFFGYGAVTRLKLVPGAPVAAAKKPPTLRRLTAEEESRLTIATAAIDDPDLRGVMERFGRTLLARRRGG
jgi:hypothetical protein